MSDKTLLAWILTVVFMAAWGVGFSMGKAAAADQYQQQVAELEADHASCGQGWYDALGIIGDRTNDLMACHAELERLEAPGDVTR